MAIETESRRLVVIEADDRDIKRAQAAIDRRAAATAKKQDEYLTQFLAKQGEVTKETLATARAAQALVEKEKEAAKAMDLVGLGTVKAQKQATALGKAYDVAGKQLKSMGMSLLSGFGAGILGGILGGSLTSIVQKAFAPPTEAQLLRMSRASAELKIFGRAVRDLARAEIERRRTAELEKAGIGDAAKAIEVVTHKNALDQLIFAERDLGKALKANQINALQYNAALRELRKVEKEWADQAARYTTQGYAANRLPVDPLTGRPLSSEESARRERRERERARAEAAKAARARNVAAITPWFEDQLAGLGATSEAAAMGQAYMERRNADRERVAREAAEGSADFYDRARRAEEAIAGRPPSMLSRGDRMAGAGEGAPTWLERTVGPVSDFDLYAAAFDSISTAATSAYDSLVEGNVGAGKAVTMFVRTAVKALGQHMFVEGLSNAARAWAEYGKGNPLNASFFVKSSAAYFAGAAAAGVIASQIGGGGGGGGAAGGRGASSSGGSGGGGSRDQDAPPAIVVLSHGFLGSDDETRRREAERMVQLASRKRAVSLR